MSNTETADRENAELPDNDMVSFDTSGIADDWSLRCEQCDFTWSPDSGELITECWECNYDSETNIKTESHSTLLKFHCDKAQSLEEIAQRHEFKSAWFRTLEAAGWEMRSAVDCGWLHLDRPAPIDSEQDDVEVQRHMDIDTSDADAFTPINDVDDPRNRVIEVYLKYVYDGVSTLDELATRCTELAAAFTATTKAGFELIEPVRDGRVRAKPITIENEHTIFEKTATSNTETTIDYDRKILRIDGEMASPIPHGSEPRWDESDYDPSDECHDCRTCIGEYHNPGCDMEECPFCGGQYLACECNTNENRFRLHSQDWFDPEDPAGSLHRAQQET